MNFSRKIILLAAVTLAISLGTACSFFDAAPEVNPQTASNRVPLHQRRCAARFQPQGKSRLDSLRASAWPQRKDSGTPPAFAIGPTAVEKKPQANCRTRKTSKAPGPLSGPF